MKKLIMFLVLVMAVSTSVFAWGFRPGKCHETSLESAKCAVQAWSACAKKWGTVEQIPGTSYTNTTLPKEGDPSYLNWLSCLADDKKVCMKSLGC